MKYKIGDVVHCMVEVRSNGQKYVLTKSAPLDATLISTEFQIVAKNAITQSYTIIIEDDMAGWIISDWHIEQFNIPKVFKGKKFWDITDEYIHGKQES